MERLDLKLFEGQPPYAAELYGVYQPLLGWRGRRNVSRLVPGINALETGAFGRISAGLVPETAVSEPDHIIDRVSIAAHRQDTPLLRQWDSLLLNDLVNGFSQDLEANPAATELERQGLLANRIDEVLRGVSGYPAADPVREKIFRDRLTERRNQLTPPGATADDVAALTRLLADRESVVAGVLHELYLTDGPKQDALLALVTASPDGMSDAALSPTDPIDSLDPRVDLDRLVLSPVGVMHLFRQYFFELDSFLGPSVQHVWLAPGSSLELVEITTRRTMVERTVATSVESQRETTAESETETELATAIRTENQNSTKFGVSLDSDSKFTVGVYTGQVKTTTKYDADASLKTAREETHKQRRREAAKVVQDLKQSVKTTFRSVTDTTATSSRRYLFQNNTPDLLNYELRRKMRRVGVQLQDLGVHLCWQAYVDRPGDQLGLANLVHVAEPPDYGAVPHPDAPPQLQPEIRDSPISFTMFWPGDDVSRGAGSRFVALIPATELVPPQPGYIYSRHEIKVVSADQHWSIEARPVADRTKQIATDTAETEASVQALQLGVGTGPGGIRTSKDNTIAGELTVMWRPSRAVIAQANAAAAEDAKTLTADRKRQAERAFFQEARDRIKAASGIASRPFEELREEERIIVFRNLVRQLLREAKIPAQDPSLRHAVSELLESFFDMERMLYFVAPEWWSPSPLPDESRIASPQDIGIPAEHASDFQTSAVSSWSGARSARADNYYITEESQPARLGASLGWVLQLDGDNLRNAFLNAPWVKAVVPIREGKTIAALNWLTRSNVEGSDGLGGLYEATDAERQAVVDRLQGRTWEDPVFSAHVKQLVAGEVTIGDALFALAVQVAERQEMAVTVVNDPVLGSTYLPQDKVFERGFEPNPGGFVAQSTAPFIVYDQWVETVPTDQVVPVQVTYDPKTGRMI